MKVKTIILVLLAFPVFLSAQLNSSIDLIIGVDYSYRTLNLDADASIPVDIVGMRNEREVAKRNWRVGFNYNKRLSSNVFLKSGIRLASVGYADKKRTDLRWPNDISETGYTPDPSLPRELQLVYDYWFIEIPLAARYEFNKKKFSPFVEAGISPSYYLTTRTKSITELGTSTITRRGGNNPYANIHLVGALSIGANYSINDNLQIFGQVAYRHHFTKLVDAPISEYLYNYGIEFGVRRKLN